MEVLCDDVEDMIDASNIHEVTPLVTSVDAHRAISDDGHIF